ncbi:bromodomain family [Trichomonas vaginalis G3]|uniref:bromodomain family n=1 Tax=Trichomonas vaginalis (strain ATCC PRA-98 / G3) TaxID=412133 RepID=UPI0021E5A2C4|nr:bromodomain family [Trichomonas vaginalis G3]KAI5530677.1 bromodomain family [Trichomonas vaginalis G3]
MHACYLFKEPTDPETFPDYLKKIKNPIDLSTIKQKLQQFEYTTIDGWYNDMILVFKNCILYNGRDTVIGELTAYAMTVFKKKCIFLICPNANEWSYRITKYRNKLDQLMQEAPKIVTKSLKNVSLPNVTIENHEDLAYNLSSLQSKTDVCVMSQILAQYDIKVDGSKQDTAFVELSNLPAAAIKVLTRYAQERGFVD